ncbi:MAG: YdcF family protein [Bacteroidota bacterium]
MQQKNKRPPGYKWIKRIAIFLFVWIIIHIVYITVDGLSSFKGNADVAIILGNRVFKDGSLSGWLQGRVDAALVLYKAGKVKKIFASGGTGTDPDNNYPEGDAMKNYLVQHGVPEEDIIADNKGQNTFLTAKDFIAWNETHHYTSAVVVSQFYHITRSKYILHKLGFKNVYSSSSVKYSWRDIGGTLREVPAFYKYLLLY